MPLRSDVDLMASRLLHWVYRRLIDVSLPLVERAAVEVAGVDRPEQSITSERLFKLVAGVPST